MRFGTWNIRSLYSAVSLSTVAMELARCKLDLVDVPEVRWDKLGTVRAGICIFIWKKERKIINWNKILCTLGIVWEVKRGLRYCATNQKVVGLIPDGVMEFFIDINPSDRTMALGSAQPLTEMSTRSFSWG
jgi:hypothetical protein